MSEEVVEVTPQEPSTFLTDDELKAVEASHPFKRFSRIYDQFSIYRTFKPGDILIRYSYDKKIPDRYSNTAKIKRFKVVHVTPNGLVYTKAYCSTGDLSKVIVCISDVQTIGYYQYEQDENIVDAMFVGNGEYSPKEELKESINKIRKLRKINYPKRLIFGHSTQARFEKWLLSLKLYQILYSIDDKFEEVTEWQVILTDPAGGVLHLQNALGDKKMLASWNFGSYDGTFWFPQRPTTRIDLENGRT